MKLIQGLRLSLESTLALILGFAGFQLVFFFFKWTGSIISGFNGMIKWNHFGIYTIAHTWVLKQVLALYLFPEVALLLLFLLFYLFFFRKLFVINRTPFVLFVFNWFYLVLMVTVFFMPLIQIIHGSGIYYSLSWLRLSRTDQLIIGMTLMILFLLNIFSVSSVFSKSLIVPKKQFVNSKDILQNLLYIWYLPVAILFIVIYLISGGEIRFPVDFLIYGIVLSLIINSFYITTFKVIV